MIQFNKYKNQHLRVSKLEDTRFEGKHPNGINVGYTSTGILELELSNNHQCLFLIEGGHYFHTSQVHRIEEFEGYDLVHTSNSVYKVEPILPGIAGVQEKYLVTVGDQEESK